MGTPSRLDIIFGKVRVRPSELNEQERHEAFHRLMVALRGQVKFLSGFIPIREMLGCQQPSIPGNEYWPTFMAQALGETRITYLNMMIADSLRCSYFWRDTVENKTHECVRSGQFDQFNECTGYLLNPDGVWYRWKYSYGVKLASPLKTERNMFTVLENQFQKVHDEFIRERYCREDYLCSFVSHIHAMAKFTIEERERRFTGIRTLRDLTAKIENTFAG